MAQEAASFSFAPQSQRFYTQVVMKEIICVCDPAEMDWFKASLAAWQPERLICTPDHCP